MFITGFADLWSWFRAGNSSRLKFWCGQTRLPGSFAAVSREGPRCADRSCKAAWTCCSLPVAAPQLQPPGAAALIWCEWSSPTSFELWLKLPSHSPLLADSMVTASCQMRSTRPLKYMSQNCSLQLCLYSPPEELSSFSSLPGDWGSSCSCGKLSH